MKNYIFITLLNLLLSWSTYAGGGISIILKVNISSNDSQSQGFIWINTSYNINIDSITNPVYLTKTIKSIPEFRLSDILVLYDYVLPIKTDNLGENIKYLNYLSHNHADSLSTKTIEKVELLESLDAFYGTYIPSDLEICDTSWLEQGSLREEIFENEYCKFIACFYDNSTESDEAFNLLLETYKKQEWGKYDTLLKYLRKNKIILIQECSD